MRDSLVCLLAAALAAVVAAVLAAAGLLAAPGVSHAAQPQGSRPGVAHSPAGGQVHARAGAKTTITLTTRGCAGCKVTPTQFRNSDIAYRGPAKRIGDAEDTLTFRVPTRRTPNMGFVIEPTDTDLSPTVAITRFKAKSVGDSVGDQFAAKSRQATGCWSGTRARQVSNTLVMRKVQVPYSIVGPGRYSAIAAHMATTWKSKPPYVKVAKNAYVPTEATVCSR